MWPVSVAGSIRGPRGGRHIGISFHEQDSDIIFIELWVDQRFQKLHRVLRIILKDMAQAAFGIFPRYRIGKSVSEKKQGATRRKKCRFGRVCRFGKQSERQTGGFE